MLPLPRVSYRRIGAACASCCAHGSASSEKRSEAQSVGLAFLVSTAITVTMRIERCGWGGARRPMPRLPQERLERLSVDRWGTNERAPLYRWMFHLLCMGPHHWCLMPRGSFFAGCTTIACKGRAETRAFCRRLVRCDESQHLEYIAGRGVTDSAQTLVVLGRTPLASWLDACALP